MKIRINSGTINNGEHSWPGYMDPPSEVTDPQTLAIALAVKVSTAEDLGSDNIEFDTESIEIKTGGKIITPDDDLTGETSELKKVAGVVFTSANRAIYNSKNPKYEMESINTEEFKLIDGKHILIKGTVQKIKMRKEPLFNEDGSRAMADGKPRFVEAPVVKN